MVQVRGVFLDTSAWIAALGAREQHHEALAARYRQLVLGKARLVTTNMVVAEMHVLVARGRGTASGLEFLEQLRADFRHEIIYATQDIVADATQHWLRRFLDHPLSLADAVSFEVMRREGIAAAFAIDRHFAIAGYELVGGESSVVTRTRRRQKK